MALTHWCLPNCDFDSGKPTKAAEYSLTDDTYAKLLAQLSGRKFDLISRELRAYILDFYSYLFASINTKKDERDWQRVLTELDELKSMTPTPTVAGSPAHNPRLRLWTASKVRGVSIIAQTS